MYAPGYAIDDNIQKAAKAEPEDNTDKRNCGSVEALKDLEYHCDKLVFELED